MRGREEENLEFAGLMREFSRLVTECSGQAVALFAGLESDERRSQMLKEARAMQPEMQDICDDLKAGHWPGAEE